MKKSTLLASIMLALGAILAVSFIFPHEIGAAEKSSDSAEFMQVVFGCPLKVSDLKSIECVKHEVRNSDNLWKIAKIYHEEGANAKNLEIAEMVEIIKQIPENRENLKNPDLIFKGMVLTIPVVRNSDVQIAKLERAFEELEKKNAGLKEERMPKTVLLTMMAIAFILGVIIAVLAREIVSHRKPKEVQK